MPDNYGFVDDMINSLSCVVEPGSARRGLRAFCRHFGGQLVYVPMNKTDGRSAERIRGVLADEVGDRDAEKILEKLMMFYGGMQVYIPFEKGAFKKDIALEIYERYDGTAESMSELCREYNATFAYIYRRVHEAIEMKRSGKQPGLFDF